MTPPCGKRCYPSKSQAREAIKHMHETVRIYQCGRCAGAWHTTQERYGKVANNARAWNARAMKHKGRRFD